MKSRITIEVDFDHNNLPVIQILENHSDDVRDRLIGHFLQSLQHTSRWCKILFIADDSKGRHWRIYPMTPYEIPEEIKLMKSVIEARD